MGIRFAMFGMQRYFLIGNKIEIVEFTGGNLRSRLSAMRVTKRDRSLPIERAVVVA